MTILILLKKTRKIALILCLTIFNNIKAAQCLFSNDKINNTYQQISAQKEIKQSNLLSKIKSTILAFFYISVSNFCCKRFNKKKEEKINLPDFQFNNCFLCYSPYTSSGQCRNCDNLPPE